MAQRQEVVQALTVRERVEITDVPPDARASLEPILEESFEGWYLRHSKRVLHDVETVRVATYSAAPVGLIMLKTLEEGVGYIFYVAVAVAHRKAGVAGQLVRDALSIFKEAGAVEVFASVEGDNLPSEALFASEGFTRTKLTEVSGRHGLLNALNMYRMMVVVPGEILLRRALV